MKVEHVLGKKVNLAVGSAVGYLTAAIFNAVLLVAKESVAPIKNWMKAMFWHHRLGHGILVLVVFIIATLVGVALFRGREVTDRLLTRLGAAIVLLTLVSAAIIAGFYATHL